MAALIAVAACDRGPVQSGDQAADAVKPKDDARVKPHANISGR